MGHRFHKFDPAHADVLVSADRGRILPPDEVLALLDAGAGDVVGDIGCGPGFFTLPLARRIQPGGRVIAVDISPDMLERLRARLPAQSSEVVDARLSAESELPIADGGCDRLLLANLLHELAEPQRFFSEVARVLRPGGMGLAVDWYPRESPFGPPLAARVPAETADRWMRAARLQPGPVQDVGPHNYAVAFRHAER